MYVTFIVVDTDLNTRLMVTMVSVQIERNEGVAQEAAVARLRELMRQRSIAGASLCVCMYV